ncbi:MAG: helix-turn-helix domain-containing protein [Gaiellaceae bacterium]
MPAGPWLGRHVIPPEDAMPDARDTVHSTAKVTKRELEVLELIADGCSTKEIATALWITEETVRTHVRRLLERLGARTRAQAVAVAFREDLWARRNGSGGEPM